MIWQKLFSKPIGKGARRTLKVIAVIAVIYGAFFFYLNRFSFMSSHELKQKMPFKTYCVGRLAVDLPAEAKIKWGLQSVNYIDIKTRPLGGSDQFLMDYHLEQRTKEVASMPNEKRGKGLLGMEDMKNPYGKLFEYYSDEDSDLEIETQALFSAGNRVVSATYRNFLSADDSTARDYPLLAGIPRARAVQLSTSIHSLPISLPAASGGSCIDGVFVSGHAIIREDIEVTAEFADIEFSINTVAMEKEVIKPTEDSMLVRMAKVSAAIFSELEEKRLRSRGRSINGIWKAEEFGSAGKTVGGFAGYSFMLEANQPEAGLATPELTIEMKASRASHSQEEILAIWDTIIDSIRPRPAGIVTQ